MADVITLPPQSLDDVRAAISDPAVVVYATHGAEDATHWGRATRLFKRNRALLLVLVVDAEGDERGLLERLGWNGTIHPMGNELPAPDEVGGVFLSRTGANAFVLTRDGAKTPTWLRRGLEAARRSE